MSLPSARVSLPTLLTALVVALALLTAPAAAGGAGNPITDARIWLTAQQEADGGFELANFPPFETPDAILALAAAGQTTNVWSTAEALAAVEAVDTNGDGTGLTALDWADDFSEAGPTAATKAKLALLVALPLGLDPTAFDPKGNGAVDLTDGLDDIAPGLFNSFLVARIVERALGENVHQNDVQVVCEAQRADGGWSFDGAPTGPNDSTADTTGFAALTLEAAGVADGDSVVSDALGFFTTTQQADGSWLSFGSPDPNSTAMAVFGMEASGGMPSGLANDPYDFIESQQITTAGPDHGRIASPNDGFGVNTFATTQSIQALVSEAGASWLPVAGQDGRECLPDHGYPDGGLAWNDDAVRWLTHFDVAFGFPDGEFKPNRTFNRQQASMWFNNTFPAVVGPPHPFTDVPAGAWWESGADFVGDASWPGGQIAKGFPDGSFRGKDPFNRGQAINWLYRMAGAPDVSGLPAHTFSDGAPWIDDPLTWAQAHGLVNGFPDGTFRPLDQINRGQGAFWLYNLAANPDAWAGAIALPDTVVFSPSAP